MSEMIVQNMHSGLMIAVIGMGVVLFFLTFMMLVMKINEIVLRFVNKFFPEEQPTLPQPKKASSANEEIAIAIAVAKNRLGKGGI